MLITSKNILTATPKLLFDQTPGYIGLLHIKLVITFSFLFIYIHNLDLCFHHLIFEIIETHPYSPQTNLPLSSFSIIHFSYAIAIFLNIIALEVFFCFLTQPVKLHWLSLHSFHDVLLIHLHAEWLSLCCSCHSWAIVFPPLIF